ncbi:MAG: hypothetical protein MJ065_08855 [Oscillospiraceae bacterium]|nr:hypothetical protein [Oscillospiraceae bacterium]
MIELKLYEMLNKECNVRLPDAGEQDWEFCAGDYKRTNDYILFYNEHTSDIGDFEKDLLINMIIQGIEDYLDLSCGKADVEQLWEETKKILINDKHKRTIIYWSCIGEELNDCWYITPKMKELLSFI